jgi:uncharacterized membrane protein YbhN (UPF0104 family)
MIDQLESFVQAVRHAIGLIADNAIAVSPWWLAAGVLLHLLHQVVRIRGWFNILHAAYPRAGGLRYRDVVAAYFAGSGLNAVIPARGGDVMKLYMVKQRIRGGRYSTLVSSFVPETLFETFCSTALVIWMLAEGFLPIPTTSGELPTLDVSWILTHPLTASAIGGVAGTLSVLGLRWLRRNSREFVAQLRRGLAILRSPRAYFEGVVTWQALGRVVRLGSLASFMAAFGLPVTLVSVLFVMAAQGGGRIIPIAPASAGLRLAMLTYGLVEITGEPVDIAAITTFQFGVGAVLLVVSLSISLVIIFRVLGTLNPRHAVRRARRAVEDVRSRTPARAGAST